MRQWCANRELQGQVYSMVVVSVKIKTAERILYSTEKNKASKPCLISVLITDVGAGVA